MSGTVIGVPGYRLQNYETDYYVRYSYRCARVQNYEADYYVRYSYRCTWYRTTRQTTMSGTVIGVPGSELRDRLLCQVQL